MPVDLAVQEAYRLGIPVYDHMPSLKEAAEIMVKGMAAQLPQKSKMML